MYKNLAGRAVLAWMAACFFACFLSPAFSQTQAPKEPLKIGFVYVTPVTDAGWVRQHEEGRKGQDAQERASGHAPQRRAAARPPHEAGDQRGHERGAHHHQHRGQHAAIVEAGIVFRLKPEATRVVRTEPADFPPGPGPRTTASGP